MRSRPSRATMLTNSISAPARSMVAGMQNSRSLCGLRWSAACNGISPISTSYEDGVPGRCSMPSAVLALPCGSRSITRILQSLQRQRRGDVDGGRGLADAALLIGDGEDALARRPGQSALAQRASGAPRVRPPRRSGCRCRRRATHDSGRARRPMFHVKHPVLRRTVGAPPGLCPAAPERTHPLLLPGRAAGSRPASAPRVEPRPRSRVDPRSPRHISSPLHRSRPTTPSHADAHGPRPRRARP